MKRITSIAVAALAVAAVAAPGSAMASGSHLLGIYKVEKHVDISGEGGTYSISCTGANDFAVDGMWRLDNVDQDNDYFYSPLHSSPYWYDVNLSVEPVEADSTAPGTYTFQFLPQSGGDAQAKLFLTCLPKHVQANNGHTHTWSEDSLVTDTAVPVPYDTPTSNSAVATSCPSSTTDPEIAVAPGFDWTSTDGYGKPYQRWPDSFTHPRKWTWGFVSYASGGATVRTSYRCLHLVSSSAGSPAHRHRIPVSARYTMTPSTTTSIKKNSISEIQTICGENYKGMLGAWDFSKEPTFDNGHHAYLWYLGMDPRPKARAYKVLDSDPSTAYDPTGLFGLVCFKDKTS